MGSASRLGRSCPSSFSDGSGSPISHRLGDRVSLVTRGEPTPRLRLMNKPRRLRWWWIAIAAVVVVLVPVAIVVVPILTHENQGLSGQQAPAEAWPLTVTAVGDDGRERSFTVMSPEPGGSVDTSSLSVGQKLVVSGTGYDPSRGIYVAICRIPDDPQTKPGPCIGGVPETNGEAVEAGTVQYAPSNWINDDWAWKLFGARSYDDVSSGTFTAYLE